MGPSLQIQIAYIKLSVFNTVMILFSPALIHTMKSYSHALCDFSDELTHSQRPHRMERKLRANITKVDRVSLIFLGTLI